jgi:hypothetical protein
VRSKRTKLAASDLVLEDLENCDFITSNVCDTDLSSVPFPKSNCAKFSTYLPAADVLCHKTRKKVSECVELREMENNNSVTRRKKLSECVEFREMENSVCRPSDNLEAAAVPMEYGDSWLRGNKMCSANIPSSSSSSSSSIPHSRSVGCTAMMEVEEEETSFIQSCGNNGTGSTDTSRRNPNRDQILTNGSRKLARQETDLGRQSRRQPGADKSSLFSCSNAASLEPRPGQGHRSSHEVVSIHAVFLPVNLLFWVLKCPSSKHYSLGSVLFIIFPPIYSPLLVVYAI